MAAAGWEGRSIDSRTAQEMALRCILGNYCLQKRKTIDYQNNLNWQNVCVFVDEFYVNFILEHLADFKDNSYFDERPKANIENGRFCERKWDLQKTRDNLLKVHF